MRQRLAHSVLADDVVSRHVSVTGIDAGRDGNHVAKPFQHFGDLFKTSAQRIFRAGGVLDQDGELALDQVKSLSGRRNGAEVWISPASRSAPRNEPG